MLVTSAVVGEGKTSLATQTAISLANRGRRTVLVDCSLRRPAVAGVFGLADAPGVSEYLRGEGELAELVRATQTGDLSVLPAGRWDRRAVTALAGEAAAGLFAELREEYDFVIIDSGPVLTLADTRFISQHADVALLCVMRDVSQVPKVAQTAEILQDFGIDEVEAVVIDAVESGSAAEAPGQPETAAAV